MAPAGESNSSTGAWPKGLTSDPNVHKGIAVHLIQDACSNRKDRHQACQERQ